VHVSLRPLVDADLDLEKAGFRRIGVNRGFARGRGEEIEEVILRLD
jgi:hypothetical protein